MAGGAPNFGEYAKRYGYDRKRAIRLAFLIYIAVSVGLWWWIGSIPLYDGLTGILGDNAGFWDAISLTFYVALLPLVSWAIGQYFSMSDKAKREFKKAERAHKARKKRQEAKERRRKERERKLTQQGEAKCPYCSTDWNFYTGEGIRRFDDNQVQCLECDRTKYVSR